MPTFRPGWTDWHVMQEVRTGRYVVKRHDCARPDDEEFDPRSFRSGEVADAQARMLNHATLYGPLLLNS